MCVCGKHFSVAHALSCGTAGYAIMKHNELRDITACLVQDVCYDVSTEPRLQPLSNENLEGSAIREESARVDVAARGFWGDGSQKAHFDIRVFNPCAQTYLTMEPQAVYLRQEKEKRRQYQQQNCEVGHGSFTPSSLIFLSSLCKKKMKHTIFIPLCIRHIFHPPRLVFFRFPYLSQLAAVH